MENKCNSVRENRAESRTWLWTTITTALTLTLIGTVHPLLAAKHGTPMAILLDGVLAVGMFLYSLRGVWLSRSGK